MSNPPPKRKTPHLVVLKFDERFNGPWHVFLFEGGKRLFRVDFQKEGPAAFLAARLVGDIRRNGWPCRWTVQDEDGNVAGADVQDAVRKVKERQAS